MNQELPPLTSYSEELRQNAMDKYQVIAPYLKHEESLSNIAEESGVPKRTLYHWVNQYQQSGLKGLIRRKRSDSGSFKPAFPNCVTIITRKTAVTIDI